VGGKMLILYNREILSAKIGFIPLPIQEQLREYRLRIAKEQIIDTFSIGIFEIISISGLAIYLTHKKGVT